MPSSPDSVLWADCEGFLDDWKVRVRSDQLKAAVAVNSELIRLYWDIGRAIVERQQRVGWGNAEVDRLATDRQTAFAGQQGFSPRNVWWMRAFYLAYALTPALPAKSAKKIVEPILPQPVAEIFWGLNVLLIEQMKDPEARLWYAKATKEFGWSWAVLEHQIETNAHGRKGKRSRTSRRRCRPRSPTSPGKR